MFLTLSMIWDLGSHISTLFNVIRSACEPFPPNPLSAHFQHLRPSSNDTPSRKSVPILLVKGGVVHLQLPWSPIPKITALYYIADNGMSGWLSCLSAQLWLRSCLMVCEFEP